jgi:ABC-type polar amino acid transport system ATPase subunit
VLKHFLNYILPLKQLKNISINCIGGSIFHSYSKEMMCSNSQITRSARLKYILYSSDQGKCRELLFEVYKALYSEIRMVHFKTSFVFFNFQMIFHNNVIVNIILTVFDASTVTALKFYISSRMCRKVYQIN